MENVKNTLQKNAANNNATALFVKSYFLEIENMTDKLAPDIFLSREWQIF